MARKSKGFQELVKGGQSAQNKSKSLESLKQKMSEGILGELAASMVMEPKGVERMSEALHEFVAPYLKPEYNLKRRQSLFSLGAIAWNAALMSDQKSMLNQFLTESLLSYDPQTRRHTRKLIDELIDRKIKYFSHIKRLIVDFEVTETRDEYHLSVASTEVENLKGQS
jgi:DNA-directed RNA polymerase beta' subunit